MHEQISHSFTGMEELFMDMNAINSVTSTFNSVTSTFNSYQTSQASKKVSETADKTTTTDKTETGVVLRNLLKLTKTPSPRKQTIKW